MSEPLHVRLVRLAALADKRHDLYAKWREAAANARAAYIKSPTRANLKIYRNARKVRNRRLQLFREAQAERNKAKRAYKKSRLRLGALREARAMLGVVEKGGNNTGPEVDRIIKANGGDIGEPWCGDFVAWCYRRAGSKVVTRAWAAAWGGFWGWFTGVRRIDPRDLKPGDIVEYNWQHTGLFDHWENKAAGDFVAVEGNTGTEGQTSDTTRDGVHRRDRSTSNVKAAFRVTR